MTLPTILLVISLVLFVLAAVGVTVSRVNLTAAGLAFAVGSVLAASHMVG
jgi:hypothetical protein